MDAGREYLKQRAFIICGVLRCLRGTRFPHLFKIYQQSIGQSRGLLIAEID